MSVEYRVATVLEDARERLGLPVFSSETNTTEAQALQWLSQSVRSYCALVRQFFPSDYDLVQPATLYTTANQNFIDISKINFGELHRIQWVVTDQLFKNLEQATPDEYTPIGLTPKPWDQNNPPAYRIEREALRFYPCPNKVYTIQIFSTDHINITNLNQVFTGKLDADKWITLDLIVKICSKKKRNAASFQAEQQAIEGQLFTSTRKNNPSAVYRIREVE